MFELEVSAPTAEVGAEGQSELQRIDATFDSFQEFVARTAAHLSAKSVFLATPEKLPAGTAVRLEVALRGGTALIRALGQVASPRESEAADGGAADPAAERPPGLDVRFTYLDPASARVIDSVSRLGREQEIAAEAAAVDEPAAPAVAAGAVAVGEVAAEAPPTPEAPEPDELPRSMEEEAPASAPEEESWELEVESLLSEVLPEDAGGPPAPAASGAEAVPQQPVEPATLPPESPATFAEELPPPGLQDLPLVAPDAWETGARAEAEEALPAIDLESSAGTAREEVQLAGAGNDDSLVLGFGESITMAPPRRRSAVWPLVLAMVGVVALGLFFYLRGDRFGLSGPGSEDAPVVAEQRPGARAETAVPGTGAAASGGETASEAPGAGGGSGGPAPAEASPSGSPAPLTAAGEPPATGSEPPSPEPAGAPPATAAEPPSTAAAPPPTAALPPPTAAEPPTPAASVPTVAAATEQVEGAVKAWAAAWTAQQVDDYLACYSPQYSPPGLDRRGWEEQRRVRVRAPKEIQVNVSNFSIELLDASHAKARFLQHYATESRNLRTWKIMELERRSEGWKIVSEQVDRR